MLKVGDSCPVFHTHDEAGHPISHADTAGQYTVLFFYPKDSTPGCTKESCEFSQQHSAFVAAGAQVWGVSKDSQASHIKFKTKQGLVFPLLMDEDTQLCQQFGVLQEKSMFGKKYMGIVRTTFLIDPHGKIIHIWDKVKVSGHVQAVLKRLQQATAA
jgi:peroxiredoxin Q/BCP